MDDNLLVLLIYMWGFIALLGLSSAFYWLFSTVKFNMKKCQLYEGKLKV